MGYTYADELKKLRNPYTGLYGATDMSSVHPDNIEVNSTIKPIDRENASAEIEKNEVVLQPDGKLFRALGKKHNAGGTPVDLPEGSFIFSNYKPLAISKGEKELFKFRQGGNTQKDNTPAKVLGREVDLKHHNKMLAIVDSTKHDEISKNSATLMIGKNLQKAGQVAYLQEEKKGFPEGLPDFAKGTAPILNKNEEIMKQYKMGGIANPFLPHFQNGSTVNGIYKGDKYASINPLTGQREIGWNAGRYNSIEDLAKLVNYPSNQELSPRALQEFMQTNYPQEVNQVVNKFGNPRNGFVDNLLGIRTTEAANRIARQPISTFSGIPSLATPPLVAKDRTIPLENTLVPSAQTENNNDNNSPQGEILPYDPRIGMSPAQLLNLGYATYNAVNIPKFYPKRAQYTALPVKLERYNAQPYINQLDNQVQQSYRASNQLNPIIARAQNSQALGQGLSQASQTLGLIDNQNKAISNQETMYNVPNQQRVNDQNMNASQDYYNGVQRTEDNAFKERRAALSNLFSLNNQYRSQNDALQLQLASQPTLGVANMFQDPVTGNIYKDINQAPASIQGRLKAVRQAMPAFSYDQRTGRITHNPISVDFNSLPSNNQQQITQQAIQLARQYKAAFPNISDHDALRNANYLLKARVQNPYGFGRE